MATATKFDDATECPICIEAYTDPRVLSCGHAFCFKCIEAWSNEKSHIRKLACPLCRRRYTPPLPSSGDDDRMALMFSQLKLPGIAVYFCTLRTVAYSQRRSQPIFAAPSRPLVKY